MLAKVRHKPIRGTKEIKDIFLYMLAKADEKLEFKSIPVLTILASNQADEKLEFKSIPVLTILASNQAVLTPQCGRHSPT
ncbi:hypothetical protein RRG08_059385 [Elysia crispata]|uniref:Uncharacterized protein n=1 Tax=Elysia crispata TaxID=231223 RepID=A0AAE1AYR7_9GAST|nr:hypothetical protein RRG08_059385 [Elysia crispata]